MLIERDAAVGAEPDENSVAIQRARQARIQHIHDLLIHAVVGEDPPNDGVAEPGMVLTVRFDDTGDVETFLLGVRGTAHEQTEIYSLQSPLGAAVLGARPGEKRSYVTPAGISVPVTLMSAIPYGLHRVD